TPVSQFAAFVQDVSAVPSHVRVAARILVVETRTAKKTVTGPTREAKRGPPRMTCPILPTFSSFKTKRTKTSARERETAKGFDRGETEDQGRLPEKTEPRHAPARVATNTEATPGLAFEIARPWR